MISAKENLEYFESNYYDDADFAAVDKLVGKGKHGKSEKNKKSSNPSKTMKTLSQLEKRCKSK